MSKSLATFEQSIKDAEYLLEHFDVIHPKSPEQAEVLKRAGLVMALTAWETYIEDRLVESVKFRLAVVKGSSIGHFMLNRMDEELKRLHNPTSDKVKKLFEEFLDFDVTTQWKWGNYKPALARQTLNAFISKRGDAVHRSKKLKSGAPEPDLVRRETLDKAIRFLKGLVAATDKACANIE